MMQNPFFSHPNGARERHSPKIRRQIATRRQDTAGESWRSTHSTSHHHPTQTQTEVGDEMRRPKVRLGLPLGRYHS